MADQAELCVGELGNTVLQLRDDLVFSPRTCDTDTFYLVEDSLQSKFYRLGPTEYTFVSLLDGDTTIDEALRLLSTVQPGHQFTIHNAASICKWLIEAQLAHTSQSAATESLAQTAALARQRETTGRLNPLIQRIAFGNPDRLFERITPWFGWLFSPLAMIAWTLVVCYAGFIVCDGWSEFALSSRGVFSPTNWAWLAGCWIVLKIVHEAAHGIVCKKFGGHVRETGVIFILLAPLAFVDVTSSWRFKSRWQRIHTSGAGMYIEILVAALAAIVWARSDNGLVNHICYNLIVMSSLTTIVFNANPLMKFDGYYILSDLLGIPNLYAGGQQYVRFWARKYLLGLSTALPPWPRAKGILIRAFGVASFGWRMFITICLTITAATLFHGAGIVLAIAAIVMWFGLPLVRFVKFLFVGGPGEQPNRIRFLLTAGLTTVTAITALAIVPWPGAIQAPVIVEFADSEFVHAGSPGFVAEVCVQSGDVVRRGDKLIVLKNEQLEKELASLRLEMKQSELRGRLLEQQDQIAAFQAEQENYLALQKQLKEKRSEVSQLTVRAIHGGTVIGRNVDALLGTHVKQGDDVVMIGNDRTKELRASIHQDNVQAFTQRVGTDINVHLPGFLRFVACLAEVDPRASVQPTHEALCGVNDGPIPVKSADQKQLNQNSQFAYEFLAPRFAAVIELDETQSNHCQSGQIGMITTRPFDESIGTHMIRTLQRWIRNRFNQLVTK